MTVSENQAGIAIGFPAGTEGVTVFQVQTLVKLPTVQVKHLTLPAGRELPQHTAPGDLIVQSLSGRVVFDSPGQSTELTSGQLLWLSAGEPHAVRAIEDSTVLVTVVKSPA